MNSWHDLETFSRVPIKNGTHAYAEGAEVMLWAYADDEGQVYVWDVVNNTLNWEVAGVWCCADLLEGVLPKTLLALLQNPERLVWFHNGGMFDFVVLKHAMPEVLKLIPQHRRRDTMVQAFAHSLPGALDKLGLILKIDEDKRKMKTGKALIRLFCMPQNEAFVEKFGTDRATKQTHPKEWQEFIGYAAGDIPIMREAHKKMPKWNYRGKQIELWHTDMAINGRGFCVDQRLATAAIAAVDIAKAEFSRRTRELTGDEVNTATQRNAVLAYILAHHGVELPDMRADTLERRLLDDSLPDAVKDLIKLRLVASMNSTSKYKALLKAVSSDGRMRGGAQYRGAGRTGRYAHRLFQFGNLPRPTLAYALIEAGIITARHDHEKLELVVGDLLMQWASSAIRGVIVAPPNKKLIVADLSNIEGRMAAWLAGEEWKLQAYRDYDTFLLDEHGQKIPNPKKKGEFLRVGLDLYIKAYMASFNVLDAALVGKDQRQIGKVEELMFQYGGGVGAWITGAATYGIDLDKMTEQVFPVLPQWALDEAEGFLEWLYSKLEEKYFKNIEKAQKQRDDNKVTAEDFALKIAALDVKLHEDKLKTRFGLADKVFIACDAIKRLWRRAHPQISSYWKEIEDTVRQAFYSPGVTFPCRKVKIRRSGSWLRVGLPSGRELCYPNIQIADDGEISYTGLNQYTRQWGKIVSYGGKFFENFTQAASCDQFVECFDGIEQWVSPEAFDNGIRVFETEDGIVVHIHDEIVAQVPDIPEFTAEYMGDLMCADLGWNAGLPLAAAGFETARYRKD